MDRLFQQFHLRAETHMTEQIHRLRSVVFQASVDRFPKLRVLPENGVGVQLYILPLAQEELEDRSDVSVAETKRGKGLDEVGCPKSKLPHNLGQEGNPEIVVPDSAENMFGGTHGPPVRMSPCATHRA